MRALTSAARPPGSVVSGTREASGSTESSDLARRQLLIPGEGFHASPPPYAPHVGSAFTVLSGGCTTSYECVYSPNYPNNSDCGIGCGGEGSILPNTQQPLDVRDFDVEWNWDFLMINNMGYTGQLDNPGHATTVPDGVVPDVGSTIEWDRTRRCRPADGRSASRHAAAAAAVAAAQPAEAAAAAAVAVAAAAAPIAAAAATVATAAVTAATATAAGPPPEPPAPPASPPLSPPPIGCEGGWKSGMYGFLWQSDAADLGFIPGLQSKEECFAAMTSAHPNVRYIVFQYPGTPNSCAGRSAAYAGYVDTSVWRYRSCEVVSLVPPSPPPTPPEPPPDRRRRRLRPRRRRRRRRRSRLRCRRHRRRHPLTRQPSAAELRVRQHRRR